MMTSGNNAVSTPVINVPFIVDESKQQPTVNALPTLDVRNFFEPFSANANFTTPLTYGVNPNIKTPTMYQWNVAIQREIFRDLSLEVAYVGNKSTYLERYLPSNLPRISATDTRPFQPKFGG